jgi:hypothetical protein
MLEQIIKHVHPAIVAGAGPVFGNSTGAEKSDPGDPVEFRKIGPDFNWRKFCIVKIRKTEDRLNLAINWTELGEIQSDSSKIQWNSRGY